MSVCHEKRHRDRERKHLRRSRRKKCYTHGACWGCERFWLCSVRCVRYERADPFATILIATISSPIAFDSVSPMAALNIILEMHEKLERCSEEQLDTIIVKGTDYMKAEVLALRKRRAERAAKQAQEEVLARRQAATSKLRATLAAKKAGGQEKLTELKRMKCLYCKMPHPGQKSFKMRDILEYDEEDGGPDAWNWYGDTYNLERGVCPDCVDEDVADGGNGDAVGMLNNAGSSDEDLVDAGSDFHKDELVGTSASGELESGAVKPPATTLASAPPTAPPAGVYDDDAQEVHPTVPSRVYPSRKPRRVKVKHEDADNGLIRCPKCKSGINVSERGCNMITCRNHHDGQGWFYFCYHCRGELKDAMPCFRTTCPERNDRESRATAKKRRNEEAAKNPIELSDSD